MTAELQDRWVCVAAVAAAHGIRGALKLRCFTARPEDVAAYGPVYDQRGQKLFKLSVVAPAKGGVIASAEGIEDRSAAEALRGVELFVPRSALPEPDDDEFYYSDLEGLEAYRPDGSRLGIVKRVADNGAGEFLEINGEDGALRFVPFDRVSVPVIDLERGRLEIADRPEVEVATGDQHQETAS